jgi:hypothetical protein
LGRRARHGCTCRTVAAHSGEPAMDFVWLAIAVLFFAVCELFVARFADRL